MSEASLQRSGPLAPSLQRTPARPLPLGYGLLIGAAASLALWGGIGWALFRAFG